MTSKASPSPALNAAPLTDNVDLYRFSSSDQPQASGLVSRIFLRVTKWKLIEYCREHPATTLFLLSLITLTVCTPMLSFYIQHYGQNLPDFDTMKVCAYRM